MGLPELTGQHCLQLDRSKRVSNELGHSGHDPIGIDRPRLEVLPPGEREKSLRQYGSAPRAALRVLDLVPRT
jgi:hypothetical protein